MSVLYPLTLRTDCTPSERKGNSTFRILIFLLITMLSFQASFAQGEKEILNRKEAELKKQEATELIEKLKTNPKLLERMQKSPASKQMLEQLSAEDQKKIASIETDNEKARYNAKMLEQQKIPSLPGVEYKIITAGNQVEYIVTNKGTEIFRQQINIAGSLYDKKVQAEKEAIYAANKLRANNNYPADALRKEIRTLANMPRPTNVVTQSLSRTTADYTFNGGGGTIPSSGAATPYPAIITASGVPAGALVKQVIINGLNHTWNDDVDIVLQSPTGINVILMSDCGGSGDLINHNYTFTDAAASSLQDAAVSPSGSYKPTNFDNADNWVAPGPGTAPNSVTLSTFGNGNHNGDWKLFVLDDLGGDSGNWGSWSIVFTDPPSVCFPIVITGQPSNTSVCSNANGSFSVVAGPPGVSYNWQVNTGSGFVYLNNGGVYSGVTTATLNITGATLAMSGYQYRVVVTCSGGGLPEISNPATLTVIASPNSPVVIPTSTSICPGGSVALNVLQNSILQTSSGTITIPSGSSSPASPYPSILTASGIPAGSIVKQVILYNFSHTWPADIDIVLQSPTGTNVILLSDRGGSTDAVNATLTFDDAAAGLVSSTAIVSGTFRPTNTAGPDAWPPPGPASFTQVNPTLATFGSGNHNGNWNLYVNDQFAGDGGSIIGWSIIFETPPGPPSNAIFSPTTGLYTDAGLTTPYTGTPTTTVYASPAATTVYSAIINDGTCNSAPTNITVTVNQPPSITVHPANGNACIGSVKTFSVTATGTGLTYQWQVDMGSGYVNITTGTPTNPGGFIYTGQTTATLSINTLLATMNTYKYRVIVSGTCTPSATSNEVILAVNSLPSISVAKSASCAPMTLTASGANTYSWSPSAGLSSTTGATVTANPTANTIYTVTGTNTTTGCSNTTTVDVKFTPPIPVVAPAAPIICLGTVQQLSITSSSLPPVANTTSSGAISVVIPDNEPFNGASHSLNVAGVTGAVQSISVTFNITHTWDSDLDINLIAPNGNILNLVGARGGSGDNFTNTTISSTSTTSLGSGTPPFSGTFAADGFIGWGPINFASNVSSFASLFSVPNGTWRLAMADFAGGDIGTLTSWSITINYASPDAGIWTPVTGLFSNSAGTIPYVAGTPASTVYASPASTTTYSVTVTNSSTETRTFSSGGTVTIPVGAPVNTASGAGDPYPTTISVSGLPANAILKSATLKGVKHSFPADLDIALQSPTGTYVILMSDVGSGFDATGQNYTFDDAAAGLMSTTALNATGTYQATNSGATDIFPAPVGSLTQATPTLASFTGDPNGTWNLYINDDAGADIGAISSWELTFTIPTPTNCTSAPRTVTVTVHVPIVYTTQPQNRTVCQNSTVTFTAAATGTIQTTQWQVSTNGGGPGGNWTNIAGATTTTLTLTNVQPSQSGYKYRLVLANTGCGAVNSAEATLIVNPLPTVSLSLSPGGQTQLRPGMLTTVTVNSTPAGASYQWFVNGVPQPQITTSSYVVDAYHLGTYTVRVTDVNGCVNTTAGVTFTALPTSNLFIYPNPTTGAYFVTYYMPSPVPVTINVIDMKGRVILQRQEATTAPYTRFDFSSSKLAAGVYVIRFFNPQGKLLASGRLVVSEHTD
jgi:subtilisin-like proprotein convertase family protein